MILPPQGKGTVQGMSDRSMPKNRSSKRDLIGSIVRNDTFTQAVPALFMWCPR